MARSTRKNRRNRVSNAEIARRSRTAAGKASDEGSSVEELQAEYSYVRKDLIQMIVVSVVLFGVMLGVGYFI